MTCQSLTEIVIVLDRSGSMESLKLATIEAFNAYVNSQRQGPGTAQLSLVQFDDQYEPVMTGVPIAQVAALTPLTYQPRGSTALFDAIGRTISETGWRFSRLPESQRPGTVLFVIQTDGYENSSRQYTSAQINAMIAEQRDKYSWQFVFLGANQDAICSAAQFGIGASSALTYGANHAGTMAAFAGLAKQTTRHREARANGQTAAWAFEETERQQAMNETPQKTVISMVRQFCSDIRKRN